MASAALQDAIMGPTGGLAIVNSADRTREEGPGRPAIVGDVGDLSVRMANGARFRGL